MSRLLLSPGVYDDLDRIFDFLFEHAPDTAVERIAAIREALDVLQRSPAIGRPAGKGQRELVISTGSSGHLALYRWEPMEDTAYVLAVRSQRERRWH